VAELLEEVPARALAVYAHPDDADVACGGTLARWAAQGSSVHVVICTTGDKGSTDAGVVPAELVRLRQGEVDRAAEVLGVESHSQLGHPDGELFDERLLMAEVVAELRRLRPDVLVCPDPTAVFFGQHYFNHRDHRAVGWAALDAASPAAAQPHYFPESGPPHQVRTVLLSGSAVPDVWVDITTSIEAKTNAVMCHRSQLHDGSEWFPHALRQRAEDDGRVAGVRHAEAFRRLVLS
jgi:LmbE family N-acetylglucosaminyl deacetylase